MWNFKEFCKDIGGKIWEGFLNNLGVVISAFIFSGGYLVAINKIKEFQSWIRSIPTDYILTPAVLLVVVLIVLIRINRKQQQQLSQLQAEPDKDDKQAKFVTHLGVWWKIYFDSDYIEDFPYCPCCEPHIKLVQTEWYSTETYKCSKTNTEYSLYDGVPKQRTEVIKKLYDVYFRSFRNQFELEYFGELRKIKELNPEMSNREISERLFKLGPLAKIPKPEVKEILDKNENPRDAFYFVERNYIAYKKYFKRTFKNETTPT